MALSKDTQHETHWEDMNTSALLNIKQISQPSQLIAPREEDGHPVSDSQLRIETNHISRSGSGISSAVEDVGDSLQLRDVAQLRSSRNDQNALAYTGAHLPITDDIGQPFPTLDDFDDDTPAPLEDLIRAAMKNAAGPANRQFMPFDELDNIVTSRNIYRELKRSGVTSELETTTFQVWSTEQLPRKKTTTRRRIFAILCLMNKANEIQAFIEENIFDSDLPFEFEKSGAKSKAQLLRRESREPIKLFTQWLMLQREYFVDQQGQFLAPYFKLSVPKYREYPLPRCAVLPFMEIDGKDSAYNGIMTTNFSVVYRVKIHLSHHDYQKSLTDPEKIYFAVKQLQKSETTNHCRGISHNREIMAYKRLNSINHPHIVRLLASYSYREKTHMVFPWADGNLYQFWEEHYPRSSDLPRNHDLARWMINQSLGLADALQYIYRTNPDVSSDDISIEDQKKTHGRHGDLKPENILWFRTASDGSDVEALGTLMISDLGSTEFHGTLSDVVGINAASGFTDTYKAPEYDIMKHVSPESDMWSFGCVLLQFIVWYMRGWDGVDDFKKNRKADSNLITHPDPFFNFDKYENAAQAKPSVRKEFKSLREDPATSDLILDILDVIESCLLRLRVEKRATCNHVVAKLREIKNTCDQTPTYCTERTRNYNTRIPTYLSEKVGVVLSEQMQYEYGRVTLEKVPDVPSGSTTPRSTHSAEDDGRSQKVGGGADDASMAPTVPSKIPEQPVLAQSEPTVRVGQTEKRRPSMYTRVMSRIFSVFKGCFKPKGSV